MRDRQSTFSIPQYLGHIHVCSFNRCFEETAGFFPDEILNATSSSSEEWKGLEKNGIEAAERGDLKESLEFFERAEDGRAHV